MNLGPLLHNLRRRRSVLIVGGIFATVVTASAVAASQPPTSRPPEADSKHQGKASENQPESQTDKHTTAGKPAAIETLRAPITRVEADDRPERHRDYSDHEWWLVYLTAALALTTLALAIYTGKLYKATVNLGKEAKDASARQAHDMKDSLGLTEIAANAARKSADAATASVRAYLNVTPTFFGANIIGASGPAPDVNRKFEFLVEILDAPRL